MKSRYFGALCWIIALLLSTVVHGAIDGPVITDRRSIFRKSAEDHASHYFMATSAIGLGRREGYYKNTMVTLNQLGYGITPHLSVNAGIDLFSSFISRGNSKWFSRVQVHTSISDHFHIGVQAAYMAIPLPVLDAPDLPQYSSNGTFNALGMITLGDREFNITFAGGPLHNGDRFARGPLVGVAAMARVAASVAVITEHWLVMDPYRNYPIHSIGVRVLGDLLAIDGGIAYDRELAAKVLPIGSPFISATLNF